jgi:uncharacterized protein (DUF2164 family)
MTNKSMRIELSGDRRDRIVRSVRKFFGQELDQDLSDFQAERVVEFFVKELGAPVYNQAIRDAHGFLQEKLEDLDGEFYEPEEPYSS